MIAAKWTMEETPASTPLPIPSVGLYGTPLDGRGQAIRWRIELGAERSRALRAVAEREGIPATALLLVLMVATVHCIGRNSLVAMAVESGDEPLLGKMVDVPEGRVTFRDLLALAGTTGTLLEAESLPLRMRVDPGHLRLEVTAHCSGLDPTHRAAFPHHVLRMLDAMLANLSTTIHSVDLVTEEERLAWVDGFNRTAVPLPEARTLAELFTLRARMDPTRVAVVCEGETVTYGALNAQANRLAHSLDRRGVGPGDVVGLYMRRTPDVLAAMLGISKAGAAWLPLDPAYPAERLAFMLGDTAARLVVTKRGLDSAPGRELMYMDDSAVESADDPAPKAREGDLAYIIFTSGSTHTPKGVRTCHRAVLTWLEAMRTVGWVTPDDCMLAHSSFCFDASIAEVFLPLVTGARVALVSRETAADGPRLREQVECCGVTTMFATPATWQMLVEAGWRGRRDFKAHCGGELYSAVLAEQIRERVGELWNVYGPTETTVYATAHRLHGVAEGLPIGRPLPNYRCYVVNREGLAVPPGVPGELLIGGPGVADGYVNRPELTAEKFVADPFVEGTLYCSGDLARLRPDGTLEILGRIDNQLKIRGFRIEPAEIEAELEKHPSVRKAVVGARGETPAERRLVAWVAPSKPVDVAELRAYLETRLPAFMVPSRFVIVASMPLTHTGKVDRQALTEPHETAEPAEMTQDLVEFQLCRIFEEVLDRRPVGRQQDYFELGGTSLEAVRLLARIERTLGRRLRIVDLFSAPTPAGLATMLRRDGWEPQLSLLVPLQPWGASPPFFCVHAFIGDVCRALGKHLGPEQPFYGIQARGLDGREEHLSRVEEMASVYLAEIKKVQAAGPYYIGGYCFGGVVAFEMARQLEQAGERVALLALVEATPPNIVPRGSFPQVMSTVFDRVVRRLSTTPVQDMLGAMRSGVKRLLAWRRLRSGQADARLVEAVAQDVLQRFQGMEQWPLGYQEAARHNLMALLRYVPGPFGGTVTLIRGRGSDGLWGTDRGWGGLAAGVDVHSLDAGHDQIMEEPHVKSVAGILNGCLEQARRRAAH